MILNRLQEITWGRGRAEPARAAGWIALDFRANRSDNPIVEVTKRLIYSPPDMPSGLRRGSAFYGNRRGRGEHAR